MRRFAIGMLALAYMLVSSEMHELLRLPVLIAHYAEHTGENPSLGFLEFVGDHYLGQDENNAGTDHESLPFHDAGHHMIPLLSDKWHADAPVLTVSLPEATACFPPAIQNPAMGAGTDIWQPPRA